VDPSSAAGPSRGGSQGRVGAVVRVERAATAPVSLSGPRWDAPCRTRSESALPRSRMNGRFCEPVDASLGLLGALDVTTRHCLTRHSAFTGR
jgi:hypothetical protein